MIRTNMNKILHTYCIDYSHNSTLKEMVFIQVNTITIISLNVPYTENSLH